RRRRARGSWRPVCPPAARSAPRAPSRGRDAARARRRTRPPPARRPYRTFRAAAPWARPSRHLSNLDEAAARAGNRALDEQKVFLGIHLVDDETDLRDAAGSHVTWHAHSLEDARRRGRRADGPRLAEMTELALRELPVGDGIEGQLYGVVALHAGRTDVDDGTRSGLDHGHGGDSP